jgi:hypothetical protein
VDEHITYWGSLVEDIVNQSRDFVAARPSWELAVAAVGILAGLLIAVFGVFFIFRFSFRRFQRTSPKFRRHIWIGLGMVVVYAGFYFGTTEVRPQGDGGLAGPLRVRLFRSEKHLIGFYPLYLVERWIRNGDLCSASYYFNIEFKDGLYPHSWLYGDGKYGRIWYDF